nr:hypothetical protein [Rhizoctonia sp.]
MFFCYKKHLYYIITIKKTNIIYMNNNTDFNINHDDEYNRMLKACKIDARTVEQQYLQEIKELSDHIISLELYEIKSSITRFYDKFNEIDKKYQAYLDYVNLQGEFNESIISNSLDNYILSDKK